MIVDKGAQRRSREAWHIAVTNEDIAGEFLRNFGESAAGRITGAALFGLDRGTQGTRRDCGSRGIFDLIGLMANHEDQRIRIEARDDADDTRDHRLATEFVEHLGAIRSHPGAESGGEDYGGERRFHWSDHGRGTQSPWEQYRKNG